MTDASFSEDERLAVETQIKESFTPYSPINSAKFFRGRIDQIRLATDCVTSSGLHALIFGERGVGKTSLANILDDILEVVRGSTRVNCGQGDSFASVIRRALKGLQYSIGRTPTGFASEEQRELVSMAEALPENGRVSPDQVANLLSTLPAYVVLVFDEFDRLGAKAKAAFADLVKSLSDRGSDTTIVIVGVAEDVNELVENHASVERCLRQIALPRMHNGEIVDIVSKGFDAAEFSYDATTIARIVTVAQGFPHYAHLLGQNAARSAADDLRRDVHEDDVIRGMDAAVRDTDQSHRAIYHQATTGTKKKNLWREVVTACALARTDERGYFATRDVQDSLSRILGRQVIQQTVAFHLGKLIEESRGPLLQRVGPERRYRYRFKNPLMRPFVLIKATSDGLIKP